MTKRTVYATVFLLELVTAGVNGVVTCLRVARRHGLSERYLSLIASALARAGLVRANRGPTGGFRLARPATDISMADILQASDGWPHGDLRVAVPGTDPAAREVLQKTWESIIEAVRTEMEKIRLSDLANLYRAKSEAAALDFQI